ncbi:MAG TPA: major capsid protein [Opitutaceae bacterium]|jgi:hypothetical protein|nr:major capsid protein [Opitutaceae bacterium]
MKRLKQIVLCSLVVGAAVSLRADPPAFDPSTYTDMLTAAASTAATLVAAVIALAAGIMVWRKVAGFFKKSGT